MDLEARVRVLEAAAEELLELYEIRQENGEVAEILTVYEELVAFREEIDAITGRMNYLEQSAAMATLTITLIPDELARPIQVGGWRPEGTARAAFETPVHGERGAIDQGDGDPLDQQAGGAVERLD